MPLETTMICIDNSEYMRNGDYMPSRFEAQRDGVNMIINAKTMSHPESTVGLLSAAGQSVSVKTSPTDDVGQISAGLHSIEIGGEMNLVGAIQVAMLALKHRKNKRGGQRIIVFVGSPVAAEEKPVTKIAKVLRKNNIALDIVSMGEVDENADKLTKLIENANKNDNSHLVTIPGGLLPSEIIRQSPIFDMGGGGGGGSASASSGNPSGGQGGNDFSMYGGVDPSLDPELAMALRVSMEEARTAAEAEAATDGDGKVAASADSSSASDATATAAAAPSDMEDEDLLMQQALALSMAGFDGSGDTDATMTAADATEGADATATATGTTEEAVAEEAQAPDFSDPSFVNSLLAGLPGVDMNDPAIMEAMQQLNPPALGGDKDGGNKDNADKDKK